MYQHYRESIFGALEGVLCREVISMVSFIQSIDTLYCVTCIECLP